MNMIGVRLKRSFFWIVATLTLALIVPAGAVQALNITLRDSQTAAAVSEGYYWVIEEDTTFANNPGSPPPIADALSANFHASHAPVVGKGVNGDPFPALDPNKRYFISVLPRGTGGDVNFNMSGAAIAPGQSDVTIYVSSAPLPTAQISVFVFEDNSPINNAPDLPQEHGLAGWEIILEEPGGQYGNGGGGTVVQDAFGNPLGAPGAFGQPDGHLFTDANGYILIQNLYPGKYGVTARAPAGQKSDCGTGPNDWCQTTTLEGTKTVDAWVRAKEPSFLTEFGPPGYHVFLGFVKAFTDPMLSGGATITGNVVNIQNTAPPEFFPYDGVANPNICWAGLNDLGGLGNGLYAGPCGEDNAFSIPNVPPGTYQLVVWDNNLETIINFTTVIVNEDLSCNTFDGLCDLQAVPVPHWFHRLYEWVFEDTNRNGRLDPGEGGLLDQAFNIRWRDGTLYQTNVSDHDGFFNFEQVFPFFNWLVAEIDFARFKATGATVWEDAGGPVDANAGPVDPGDPYSFTGLLNPKDPNGTTYVSGPENGTVLLQAFQGFAGHTTVMHWGKAPYGPGENGGITGIVYYTTTRAEDDPRYAAGEAWEPGVPRVQINLYRDFNNDGVIDDNDGSNSVTPADVDNYPLGWADSGSKGPEDVDHDNNGVFDQHDAVEVVWTDSWDDNQPTGCPFNNTGLEATGIAADRCFDGLRNYNQVRPGVFDGGYAFSENLPVGWYIVEMAVPRGPNGQPKYELQKEEDKNVDFGVPFIVPAALPAECVGNDHLVPDELALFPGIEAFYHGQHRPLCDRKKLFVDSGANPAADFFVFTQAPVAAHVVGLALNDIYNVTKVNGLNFGEKFGPPFMPISFRDWTGRELTRVYTDQEGKFNALVPSTFSVHVPSPSGVSPNMLVTCLNDPVRTDGTPDPFFNPQYSATCYTFQYMPGTTTYLDTPVLPVAAFASDGNFPVDCELHAATPRIARVDGNLPNGGPYVQFQGVGASQRTFTIHALGTVMVPNPDYDGMNDKLIPRGYGFGPNVPGRSVTLNGVPQTIVSWSDTTIQARLQGVGNNGTYQLNVTRGDNGRSTVNGITLTVGGTPPIYAGASIQAAIDAASPGALVLVPPGEYKELVVMWKPVRLQGYGESTIINASSLVASPAGAPLPVDLLEAWDLKLSGLVDTGMVDLLPGQVPSAFLNLPALLFNERAPAVLVLGKRTNSGPGYFGTDRNQRIDGFTMIGASNGGAVIVNGYAKFLRVGNNRFVGNSGTFNGGVRVGHPTLPNAAGDAYEDAGNDFVRIHHNQIVKNGALGGAGGGVSLHPGADDYEVSDNFICGNYTAGNGAGIGHLGLMIHNPGGGGGPQPDAGKILNNQIVFNQSFDQSATVTGGGIFIGGQAPLVAGQLSPGTGSVLTSGNLVQGNLAGAGDGGGVSIVQPNGLDVQNQPSNQNQWYRITIQNSIVANNITGLAGGGVALQDAARVVIQNTTIAHNDSLATAQGAFTEGVPDTSNPQPGAGVVGRVHSPGLAAAFANNSLQTFANPAMSNDTVWENRQFHVEVDTTGDIPLLNLVFDGFDDLAVAGAVGDLTCTNCVVSDQGGMLPGMGFVASYFNVARGTPLNLEEAIRVTPAFDEGGNFIDIQFGPLTLWDSMTGALLGDYRIQP